MITREEYELLKNYRDIGFNWIARDKNLNLFTYREMPRRSSTIWNVGGAVRIRAEHFTFVKWEDEKPTKILDLIQDYEAHQVITQESNKVVIPDGYEVLSDEWLAEHSEFADGIGEFYIYETLENMEKLLIPKNVKVTIPQYVADWIEDIKNIYTLKGLFKSSRMPESVKSWIACDNEKCELMALAWIYGYEVDKEKLYTVQLKNGYHLCKYEGTGVRWLNMTEFNTTDCYKLTQAEIESVDPRLMQFAVEVE